MPMWCHMSRDDGNVHRPFYGKDNSFTSFLFIFVLCIKMIYRYWASPSCNHVFWIKRTSCCQYDSVDKMFDTKENEVAEILQPMWCHMSRDDSNVHWPLNAKDSLLQIFQQCTKTFDMESFCVACLVNA